jgi:hypothetical protein
MRTGCLRSQERRADGGGTLPLRKSRRLPDQPLKASQGESLMNEFKALTASKTFWGAVVALAGAALQLTHYTLAPDDAAQAVDLLSAVAGAAGGLVAIYGRVVATKKIKA